MSGVFIFMPTDPHSTSHLVLHLLRNGVRPAAYILGSSGATAATIKALVKRGLIVQTGKNGKTTLRLSSIGLAIVEAVSSARHRGQSRPVK